MFANVRGDGADRARKLSKLSPQRARVRARARDVPAGEGPAANVSVSDQRVSARYRRTGELAGLTQLETCPMNRKKLIAAALATAFLASGADANSGHKAGRVWWCTPGGVSNFTPMQRVLDWTCGAADPRP